MKFLLPCYTTRGEFITVKETVYRLFHNAWVPLQKWTTKFVQTSVPFHLVSKPLLCFILVEGARNGYSVRAIRRTAAIF